MNILKQRPKSLTLLDVEIPMESAEAAQAFAQEIGLDCCRIVRNSVIITAPVEVLVEIEPQTQEATA